jgi:hypothetical protein
MIQTPTRKASKPVIVNKSTSVYLVEKVISLLIQKYIPRAILTSPISTFKEFIPSVTYNGFLSVQ